MQEENTVRVPGDAEHPQHLLVSMGIGCSQHCGGIEGWVLSCAAQMDTAMLGWIFGHPKLLASLSVCTEKAVTHPCSSQGWGILVGLRMGATTMEARHPKVSPSRGSSLLRFRLGFSQGCSGKGLRALPPREEDSPGPWIHSSRRNGISASSSDTGPLPQALELTLIQIAPEIIRSADAFPSLRASLSCTCGGSSALQTPAAPPGLLQGQQEKPPLRHAPHGELLSQGLQCLTRLHFISLLHTPVSLT